MTIGVAARKVLWTRAGNECAYPGCTQPLTVDLHDSTSAQLKRAGVVLGEEAHIRSGQAGGPRYDPNFPRVDIDSYSNLILLCPTHHSLVDKDGGSGFTVNSLMEMKEQHEATLRASRTSTEQKQLDIEQRTAAAIEAWSESSYVVDWDRLTYGLNQAIPGLSKENLDSLIDVGGTLLAKVWPEQYPRLADAFDRHRQVIALLTRHMVNATEDLHKGGTFRVISRAYKRLNRWDEVEHNRLFRQFLTNCVMTWWLTRELVLTANLVVRAIHAEVDPLFRFEEGLLMMHEGDGVLEHRIIRLEYDAFDVSHLPPLPNLEMLRSKVEQLALDTDTGRADDVDLNDISFGETSGRT
jgi:hypothetical protein